MAMASAASESQEAGIDDAFSHKLVHTARLDVPPVMSVPTHVRVFAPATLSNLGPGFDVLGLALERPGDHVEAEWSDHPGVELVEVTGDDGRLPREPERNVVGIAARAALEAPGRDGDHPAGVRLWLHKGMPLGSGLGSSAASSVAGALAVSELRGGALDVDTLIGCALEGERFVSGGVHADNVAPSVRGGIVLIRSYDPFELLSLPVPSRLRVAVVHPHTSVMTAEARRLVADRRFEIGQAVANLGQIAAMVTALHREDLDLFGRAISDALVEPIRAPLIPGFAEVKQTALDEGGLGCSISGSGPSVFAFAASDDHAARLAGRMAERFAEVAGLACDTHVGPVNTAGARRVSG